MRGRADQSAKSYVSGAQRAMRTAHEAREACCPGSVGVGGPAVSARSLALCHYSALHNYLAHLMESSAAEMGASLSHEASGEATDTACVDVLRLKRKASSDAEAVAELTCLQARSSRAEKGA